MKTIITTVALATLIVSPAFAAKKSHNRHVSAEAYAQQVQTVQTQRHSTNPRFDVYQSGQYVGSDPDPMIRMQLQREEISTSD